MQIGPAMYERYPRPVPPAGNEPREHFIPGKNKNPVVFLFFVVTQPGVPVYF
jgi:hypothetical protein